MPAYTIWQAFLGACLGIPSNSHHTTVTWECWHATVSY